MSSGSDNGTVFKNANQLESGQPSPKLSRSATWSSTVARTFRSSQSVLKRALSCGPELGKALKPNTSSSKVPINKLLKLEDYPRGYPQLSYLLDSDDSFMIYRRFGRLHSRVLLHKQDQLRSLDEDLLRLDRMDEKDPRRAKALHCREEADYLDPPADEDLMSRQDILKESEKLLLEYGTLLQQAHTFQEMAKPTARDHVSVYNYFERKEPLVDQDRGFILQGDDLVTIRAGNDHAWLDSLIEAFLRWYSRPLIKKFFCDEQTLAKTSDRHVHYFSRTRINFIATLIITMLISILLILPIWLLFYVTLHPQYGYGTGTGNVLLFVVLLSFTILFNCTLSFFTKIRRHEMLAASVG